jgi:hypothetical protein
MTRDEDTALEKFLDEMVAKGYICPIKIPIHISLLLRKEERRKITTGTRLQVA